MAAGAAAPVVSQPAMVGPAVGGLFAPRLRPAGTGQGDND
jgi:hypothetical protein